MIIALTVAFGVLMGIIFGIVLEKSRVIDPENIIGQFQCKKFIMLKVFLTAIVTGLCVFSIFFACGIERLNWKVMSIGPDLLGGLLLGAGIALAGACPGTVFAQIGAGYKDALATLAGAFFGALVFAWIKPQLMTLIPFQWPCEKKTLDVVLGLPFYVVALMLICCLVGILWILEKHYPWKKEVQ
jgi:uncharacterized protein